MELLLISQLHRQCWHVSQCFWWYQLANLLDFVFKGPPGLPGFKGDPGNKGEKVSLPPVKTILLWTAGNKGDEPLNLSVTAGSCWDLRFSRSPGRPW